MITRRSAKTDLAHYLKSRKRQVDKTLLKIVSAHPAKDTFKNLDGSFKHTVLLDGKRLRPILALAVYELFNDDITPMLAPACAIELIHAGSLMLDDLPCMDNAALRRGQTTNHLLYGESVTILASAALWVQSFQILSEIKGVPINQLVQETSECIGKNGLILGQYMDLFAFDKSQSLDDLAECYALKTSSLFLLAVRYGATIGGASPSERAALEEFGNAFGIAFQIKDDIIDATQSQALSGKDTQKDRDNNKPNYVSLLGIEGAQQALATEISHALGSLKNLRYDTSRLVQLVEYLRA